MLTTPLSQFLLAALAAGGMWAYNQRVLIPTQVAVAARYGRPRGNLSDLYPRWLGTRELLLHGRDPYSDAVTREIQQGYYGRALNYGQPGEPLDHQAFAYPIYVAFYLAPTVQLSFESARRVVLVVLIGFTLTGVLLWPRLLGWKLSWLGGASLVLLAAGNLPMLQDLLLQQPTLLIFGLIAIALRLMQRQHFAAAGVALALATIKPQLVVLFLLWLTVWTGADWRKRYRWMGSFLLTMAVLFAASEWYLPGWFPRFLQALVRYRTYTDQTSVLEKVFTVAGGAALESLALAVTAYLAWKGRGARADQPSFVAMAALLLLVTLNVMPTYFLYNQIFALPAILVLWGERSKLWERSRAGRVALTLAASPLLWAWLTALILAGLSLVLPAERLLRVWTAPLWPALAFPPAVAVLALLASFRQTFPAPLEPRPS